MAVEWESREPSEGKWIDLREILAQVLAMQRRKPPAKGFTTLLSFFLLKILSGPICKGSCASLTVKHR